MKTVVTEINRCANAVCPNKPGEGRFVTVASGAPIVGGHRPLVLILCAPCASAMGAL